MSAAVREGESEKHRDIPRGCKIKGLIKGLRAWLVLVTLNDQGEHYEPVDCSVIVVAVLLDMRYTAYSKTCRNLCTGQIRGLRKGV